MMAQEVEDESNENIKKRLHDDPCFKIGYSCATCDIMEAIFRRVKGTATTPEIENVLSGLVDEIQNLTQMLETGEMN